MYTKEKLISITAGALDNDDTKTVGSVMTQFPDECRLYKYTSISQLALVIRSVPPQLTKSVPILTCSHDHNRSKCIIGLVTLQDIEKIYQHLFDKYVTTKFNANEGQQPKRKSEILQERVSADESERQINIIEVIRDLNITMDSILEPRNYTRVDIDLKICDCILFFKATKNEFAFVLDHGALVGYLLRPQFMYDTPILRPDTGEGFFGDFTTTSKKNLVHSWEIN